MENFSVAKFQVPGSIILGEDREEVWKRGG